MLKLKDNLLITENEARLIESINCDNESGRHLISERSEDYWNMRVTIELARLANRTGTANEKQKQILEYCKQSADYFYWKGLSEDEKLFFETEQE